MSCDCRALSSLQSYSRQHVSRDKIDSGPLLMTTVRTVNVHGPNSSLIVSSDGLAPNRSKLSLGTRFGTKLNTSSFCPFMISNTFSLIRRHCGTGGVN